MPLKFHCVCGQAIVVSRRLIGKGVRCPSCDVKVKVPAPRGSSPASNPRAAAALLAATSKVAGIPTAESPDPVAEEVADAAMHGVARGCEPHPRHVAATKGLAWILVAIAICGASPAVVDIFSHLRTAGSPGVAVWAYLSLWIALIEISYAIYLIQLPDWSSVWVATLVTLAIAAGYAMLLGLTYLSAPDGWLVRALDLSDQLAGGRAAGFCFIMVCLTSLVSYLCGRMSVRWYHAAS